MNTNKNETIKTIKNIDPSKKLPTWQILGKAIPATADLAQLKAELAAKNPNAEVKAVFPKGRW